MLEIEEGWNGADDGKSFHRINYGLFSDSPPFLYAWDESICGIAQQFANSVHNVSVQSFSKTAKRNCRKQRFDCFGIIVHLGTFKQSEVILFCVEVRTACSLLLCSAGVRYQITAGFLSGAAQHNETLLTHPPHTGL